LLEKGPDFRAESETELKDIFERKNLGYIAEVWAIPAEFFRGYPTGSYGNILTCPNRELPQFPIKVGGRYFKVNDPRHRKHALSLRILDSKSHMNRQKETLAKVIGEMIIYLADEEFDYLTRVPLKPPDPQDRMKEEIEHIPLLNFRGKKMPTHKIRAALLTCFKDYPPTERDGLI